MNYLLLSGIGISFSFLFFVFFFIIQYKKRQRNKIFNQKIIPLLKKVKNIPDTQKNQKILEYDKILDMCLFEKIPGSKNMNTGAKMKKVGRKFKNENSIWNAHKTRNRIAHEVGFIVNKKTFIQAEKSFIQEIENLIQK